jgi:hypothetical protein
MSPLQLVTFLLLALGAAARTSLHHRQTDSTDNGTLTSSDAYVDNANITIDQLSTSGAGCPRSSTSAVVSADKKTVTISGFEKSFHAAIGPAASQGDRQKNCVVQMHVSRTAAPVSDGSMVDGVVAFDKTTSDGETTAAPLGNAQFTIRQATLEGFARLDAGVLGRLYSSFYFSQNPDNMVRCTRPPICPVHMQFC